MNETGESMQPTPDTTPAPTPNTEGIKLQATERVEVFLNRFLQSDIYSDAYKKFYEGKTIKPGVSERLKREVFERSDNGMVALYNFFQNRCRLEYNPLLYPPKIRDSIREYIRSVQDLQNEYNSSSPDRDRIVNADVNRTASHLHVADSLLKNGIVRTKRQGEFVARVIVVQQGIEEGAYLEPEPLMARASTGARINSNT